MKRLTNWGEFELSNDNIYPVDQIQVKRIRIVKVLTIENLKIDLASIRNEVEKIETSTTVVDSRGQQVILKRSEIQIYFDQSPKCNFK